MLPDIKHILTNMNAKLFSWTFTFRKATDFRGGGSFKSGFLRRCCLNLTVRNYREKNGSNFAEVIKKRSDLLFSESRVMCCVSRLFWLGSDQYQYRCLELDKLVSGMTYILLKRTLNPAHWLSPSVLWRWWLKGIRPVRPLAVIGLLMVTIWLELCSALWSTLFTRR